MQEQMTSEAVDRQESTTIVSKLGEIVGVLLVGITTVFAGVAMFGQGLIASIASIWAANVLVVICIYAGLRFRKQGWMHLGLRNQRIGLKPIVFLVLKSVGVFVVAIIAFIFGAILAANVVGVQETADMSKYDYLQGNLPLTLVALLSVYIVSSLAEEVIYRGFLITRICELAPGAKWMPFVAVVVSSLIFGAVHSDWGLAGMIQASCMGLALGTSYLLFKRNLWVMILAHAYMDTILILQMYFAGP